MVLSDAQPIQFWPVDCDTFNEHVSDGVHHVCFCQPVHCDDTIVIQGYVVGEGSPPVADDYTLTIVAENGGTLAEIPFDVQEVGDKFVYSVTLNLETMSPDLCSTRVQFQINNASTVTSVAKSDCIDIADHDNTILITYSNHRNFAGLVYQNASPEFEFYLRVPAIFYHQRFPEEDEVIELSSSLVALTGELKRTRLMDTDYMPYYMHEKIKLVLKHQFVSIYNKEWVKEAAYELSDTDRRWPVTKAKCWITEKEFVHRNVL